MTNHIKQRLINAVRVGDWQVEDNFTDNFSSPPPSEVIDCIMFYVTEFICNKVLIANNCQVCLDDVKNPNPNVSDPRTKLLQIKYPHNFVHPNETLFTFVCQLEELFKLHCMTTSVYEKVIEGMIERNLLSFPCETHGPELLSDVVHYYIRLRMHNFTMTLNRDNLKSSQIKKKRQNFVKPNVM